MLFFAVSRKCTLWSSPCFHIQEVRQFLPKGRTLSASMESELLTGLYDYCPMGAQMGGELLSVLLSSGREPQTVFTFVQER